MKILKGGLFAAILALFALALSSTAASARDPIGAPWAGSGNISLQGGLGGSACNIDVEGYTNGLQIDDVVFSNCSGAAGTPIALTPWTVSWNSTLTGGTIAVRALANVLGLASCLYVGNVAFTYSGGVVRMAGTSIPKVSGPSFPCPANVTVSGTITRTS